MPNTRRSRFVMVNGVKTHYTESGGDGPVIVAMHGGGHGSSGEAGLGRLLELLGDRYRVIGLDSIGGYRPNRHRCRCATGCKAASTMPPTSSTRCVSIASRSSAIRRARGAPRAMR